MGAADMAAACIAAVVAATATTAALVTAATTAASADPSRWFSGSAAPTATEAGSSLPGAEILDPPLARLCNKPLHPSEKDLDLACLDHGKRLGESKIEPPSF